MHRRVRNTLLFGGTFIGTVLLVLGFVALERGEGTVWAYFVGAVLAFILAFAPGRRLRDKLLPPDA